MFKLPLLLLGFGQVVFSRYYYWETTWVEGGASPDGYNRPVIGINGKWPPPVLEADVGEKITITVNNKLGNESVSLHWHGIHQEGSNTMDGATPATQCPIPPGAIFTYSFVANVPGTYWYHGHNSQFPDGLRAPMIVRDPNAPYKNKIEKEYTITLSDWYHTQMPELLTAYQGQNTSGAEPVPDSLLINDGAPADYPMEAGKTYLFRILNIGAFPSFFVNFAGHNMTVVEMDGQYTHETEVKTIVVGAAMRYGVLVTAKEDTSANFDFSAWVDASMFQAPFKGNPVLHATLVYDQNNAKPEQRTPQVLSTTILPPNDDTKNLPLDDEPIYGPVTKTFTLDFGFKKINGVQRAVINDITFLPQKVPTLYTAISAGKKINGDPKIYGTNSNPMVVNYGDVVEVVIINRDNRGHPWHLHGHKFQTVARSPANATVNGINYDPATQVYPPVPAKRDVIGVQPLGWTVIRFKATNPGVHIIHCHIEWHIESGLSATFIEAPEKIDERIPLDHKLTCIAAKQKYEGNAAGNTDFYDLDGQNDEVSEDDSTGALWTETSWWWL